MNDKRPKVSIIMNCLNCSKYLREAIDSVYAQTYKDWEIIFWDNASTDNSAEIAQSYDERLRYFASDKTVPLGEARNSAIEKASGEYIAFLDCDDKWMPEKLEKQIRLFEGRPNVGLVFSDAMDYYGHDGKADSHFKNIGVIPRRGRIFSDLLMKYFISMPTVMLRFDALRKQREWFANDFQVCTDYDLFLRIAHDWECDYVDSPLAVYRIYHGSATERFMENIYKERLLTIEKFSRLYPDFNEKYKNEISTCYRVISFQEGKLLWKRGEGRQARSKFRRHLKNPKHLIAYFASFFPYSLATKLLELYRSLGRKAYGPKCTDEQA